jgi:uncharacterized damage-inducible protein DinB
MPDHPTAEEELLTCAKDKLSQLIERIESCVDRLTIDQLWMRGSETQNSVGNLMLHLAGNVRQWILHGVAGEPDHRNRDWEFSTREKLSHAELKRTLRASVNNALALFESLPPEKLLERTSIQNYNNITKLRAIFHVVEHFSGHTGQIIFMTKWFTGEDLGFYTHLKNKAHGQSVP